MEISEIRLLLHALCAVSPTGGGSPQWTLVRKLIAQYGLEPNPQEVLRLQRIAVSEQTD